MTKLTDSQLILLSRASQHRDGMLEDAGSMNPGAASKVAGALIRKKLMKETRAKTGMPVWRKDDDDRSWSLMITKAGLKAIGAEDDAPATRSSEPVAAKDDQNKISNRAKASFKQTPVKSQSIETLPPETLVFRPGSKQAKIVDLLQRAHGASIADMMEATGWLPHSTRAALTGLRKRGVDIERSSDPARGTIYTVGRSLETAEGA